METILVILHVCFAITIVGLVLLQRSEGGGLGMGGGGGGGGGGMGGLMSSRGTASLLTRATAVVAALFFASSMALSILVANTSGPRSIIDEIPAATESTAPSAEETVPSVPVGE